MKLKWLALPTLAALIALPLLAEAGKKKKGGVPDAVGPTVVAPSNIFLRNAFDTDPSAYVGRFVPAGALSVDESSASKLTCTQHIIWRTVDGGGVVYDETFNTTTEAALRIGIPQGALGGSGSGGTTVRVKYELTTKMIGEPDDPAAFEACCKAAPDQCTDRYIGEFLEGKGQVFYAAGREVNGKVKSDLPVSPGELEMKNGVAWARSIAFPNPVYFAFKTTNTGWSGQQAVAGCGDWVNGPPKSTQGHYFVGVSDPLAGERVARDGAMSNARVSVVRWLGEQIEVGAIQTTQIDGAVGGLTAMLQSTDIVQTAATGVASLVKDEAWCVTPEATPEGTIYVAKVLAFLPKASETEAAAIVTGSASR